jgi:hypothetical protein
MSLGMMGDDPTRLVNASLYLDRYLASPTGVSYEQASKADRIAYRLEHRAEIAAKNRKWRALHGAEANERRNAKRRAAKAARIRP